MSWEDWEREQRMIGDLEEAKREREWEEDCLDWHGRVLDGEYSHWCPEWDDMPIDETCDEFSVCICDRELIRRPER